jgi:sugar phosphate isomerase/epimerase
VKIIVFGSGGSRSIPDGFSKNEATGQFVELCKQLAPLAAKQNVVVVIEPLNKKECNFINSVAEGGEIVKAVNHRNIRLLADLYHMKMDDEGPENIIRYGNLLRHVHIAEKEGRSAPGTHGEDFTPYFDALKQVKYRGAISIECKWEDMEKQAPVALRTIIEQWNL